VFNPAAGAYSSSQQITITSSTSGAIIHYTSDGNTPTCSTGTVYSSSITLGNSDVTYKAVACLANWIDSSVTTTAYTIMPQVALPGSSPSPLGPICAGTQDIYLFCPTGGATIYYTMDGNTPIPGVSPVYNNQALYINVDTTIKVIATNVGYTNSNVYTANYIIDTQSPDCGGGL
jgi:Chitobiase/beta-hexosaminidase C-terminal domain